MTFSVQSINNITNWVQSAACSQSHHLLRFHILIYLSLQALFIYWLMHGKFGNRFYFWYCFEKSDQMDQKRVCSKNGTGKHLVQRSKWIKLDQKIIELSDRFCRTFGPGKPHFLDTFARTAGCPYPPNFIFERVFLGFLDFDSL